jgi:gas vesicle protein
MSTHMPHDAGSRDHTFMLGLLAGAAVGGSLALLFAPREGSDIRQGLAQGARQAGRRISETYGTVADTARRGARQLASQAERVRSSGWSRMAADDAPWPEDRAASPSEVFRAATAEATYTPSQTESSREGLGNMPSGSSVFRP